MTITDKVVIVTGAGSGIGKAISTLFAENSALLTLVDIDDAVLETEKLCSTLSKERPLSVIGDVTDDAFIKRLVGETVAEFGRIDALVNCAGIYRNGSIESEDTMAIYDKVMSVNLRAVFSLTHECVPHLIESKGCIVNMSSVTSEFVSENVLAYSVSKAAVKHLTKCLALELAGKGVRVNAVAPGAVWTNLLINAGKTKEESDEFWTNEVKEPIPVEEVAELVRFLVSDSARSVTGAEYLIDNGFLLTRSVPTAPKNK